MSDKNNFIKKVIINRRAYDDLVIYASRFASEFIEPDKQREVYGVLIGTVDKTQAIVHVKQAIGIVVGERTGVEFESKQYVDMSQIDETIWKHSVEYNEGDFICGWWHTHPGFGFFYSNTDTVNHLGFQSTNPYAIGIVYDYTQRKTELLDSGIEVLTLEPNFAKRGEKSDNERVSFKIQNLPQSLSQLDLSLKDKIHEIKEAHSIIQKTQKILARKEFAQIQRNYGLLLLAKKKTKNHKSKKLTDEKEKFDEQKEEDKWLYEWNENNIKTDYNIPKFRKKIERDILRLKKDRKNIGKGQILLEQTLKKPQEKVRNIYSKFKENLIKIRPYRRWLDGHERLILSHFNDRITQYIKVLNALISKTYHLLPNLNPLENQLFDGSVIDKIFYGKEEIVIDPSMLLDNRENKPILTTGTSLKETLKVEKQEGNQDTDKDSDVNEKVEDINTKSVDLKTSNYDIIVQKSHTLTVLPIRKITIPKQASKIKASQQAAEKILKETAPKIPQKRRRNKKKKLDLSKLVSDLEIEDQLPIEAAKMPQEPQYSTIIKPIIVPVKIDGKGAIKIDLDAQNSDFTFKSQDANFENKDFSLTPLDLEDTANKFQISLDEIFEDEEEGW
jgi:proteasome lid subunit RPN8/RPN11